MKLVYWPSWVGCYIWYSEEGTGRGRSLPRLLLARPVAKSVMKVEGQQVER